MVGVERVLEHDRTTQCDATENCVCMKHVVETCALLTVAVARGLNPQLARV